MKSVPIPTIAPGSIFASATAAGTAVHSAVSQSSGSCSAHEGGSGAPVAGRARSITPARYACDAVPSTAPSSAAATTARAERVPKSIPTTYMAARDVSANMTFGQASRPQSACERKQR